MRDVQLQSLRRQIGIVQQETRLFAISIRENIAFGVPDATDAEVRAAARAARADEFIEQLPDGYATILEERGTGLPGVSGSALPLLERYCSTRDSHSR